MNGMFKPEELQRKIEEDCNKIVSLPIIVNQLKELQKKPEFSGIKAVRNPVPVHVSKGIYYDLSLFYDAYQYFAELSEGTK